MCKLIKKQLYFFALLMLLFCVSSAKTFAATPKQAEDPDYSWRTKINNKVRHMNNLPVMDWVTTMTSGGGEEMKNFITQGRNPDGSYVKFFSNMGNGKGTPVTWKWSDIQRISKQSRYPVKWKTKTVNGKKYQYTTYGRADNVNHLSFYSYEGSFNIDPTYDMDDMQFTILPVSENAYLYLDVDMYAFVYPACLENEINDKNFMDYFVFWSGTQRLWKDSKFFHGKPGVKLKDAEPPDKFNTFTNWWANMDTANASEAVKNGWKQVKNRADYDGEWRLRIVYGANGTGGSYRFLVGAEFEQPQIIYYPGKGATGNALSENKIYEESYTIRDNRYKRENYKFTGWNTKEDGTGTPYEPGDKYTKERPLTLYAQWAPTQYLIRFDGNGATAGTMKDMTCKLDKSHTLTGNAYQRAGYFFTGWNLKKNGSGTGYPDKASVKNLTSEVGGTVTLYAQWSANSYRIRFDGNSADSGSMAELICSYGQNETLTKNEYLKKGYTFTGWNLNQAGDSTAYADQAVVKNLTDQKDGIITLYAQWKANTYTVTFDGNGATNGTMEGKELTMTYDQPQALPLNQFVRENEERESLYLGWSMDSGAMDPQYEDGAQVVNLTEEPGGVVVLYAVWDDCPGIAADDLYYSLEQAQSGFITADELMSHATCTDREDGDIPAGVNETNSFVLRDYAPTDFTQFKHEGSVTETYLATDSRGNQTHQQITVYIVDTEPKPVKPNGTTRFINEKYYYQPFEMGGLEDNSVWKTDPKYVSKIKEMFDNINNDTPQYAFEFTHEDILEMKEYVKEHGVGNSKEPDALQKFYDKFAAPNRTK